VGDDLVSFLAVAKAHQILAIFAIHGRRCYHQMADLSIGSAKSELTMERDETVDQDVTRLGEFSSRAFLKIEVFAYLVLGIFLALTALLGIGSAAVSLWKNVQEYVSANSLVLTIDRLLFVLMVVEILHTVRVSFRSGTLVCEPFLIVGLIASIRRVLVITLESSQVNQPGNWTPETQGLFNSTMLELGVLGGLILIMVISICLLRYSERSALRK
jgi:uncharacterized membrane protein (DUF373 family)